MRRAICIAGVLGGAMLGSSVLWGQAASPVATPEQAAAMRAKLEDWAQLGRYAAENASLPAPAAGESRVVFFGDSITDAWGRGKDTGSFFPGKPYVNRGISGQTTPQMLVRFEQDVVRLKPTVVVILAGTNDVAGNTGPETPEMVEDNFRAMAAVAKANGIRVVLASILPASAYPWKPGVQPAEKIRTLNTWLKGFCAREGLAYLDYYTPLADARGGMREGTSKDGVHPNAVGYAVMTPLAERAIAEATADPRAAAGAAFLREYRGSVYQDARHAGGAQKIPGTVECAFYDAGGEGVAYHDTDAVNRGSGVLNPADGSYLNEFRMREGVDTSYTKFHQATVIDGSPFNKVVPPADQMYVGWTEPGEWFRVTVEVAEAGVYSGDLLYTSNRGGAIAVDANGAEVAGPLEIPSTFDAKEPIPWRQWHHWNVAQGLIVMRLPAGRNVLTIHVISVGQMNLATIAFRKLS